MSQERTDPNLGMIGSIFWVLELFCSYVTIKIKEVLGGLMVSKFGI